MQLSDTKKQAGNAWIQLYDIWEETKTYTGRYQICDYLGVREKTEWQSPKGTLRWWGATSLMIMTATQQGIFQNVWRCML